MSKVKNGEVLDAIPESEEVVEEKFNFRTLNENDYEIIKRWWKWWRWPALPRDFLPDNGKGGFMIEKKGLINKPIASGFVYITNSNIVLLEWIISNPEYKEDDREEVIELLINKIEEVCREIGYKYILTMVKNKRLIKTHKKLGWVVDKKPSYEITKKL